jgi:TonB family protein
MITRSHIFLFYTFILIGSISHSFAQEDSTFHADTTKKIFQIVQQQPQYPGGYMALLDFLKKEKKYPKEARRQGIEGDVKVSFVIGKDGNVSNVEVFEGVHPLLDAEAVRVIWNMPAWKPAMHKGKPVFVKYILPIKFKRN